MPEVTVQKATPPPPPDPIESVTLVLSPEEAAVVCAFIGNQNSGNACARVAAWYGRYRKYLDLPATGPEIKAVTSTIYYALDDALLAAGRRKAEV